MGSMGMAIASDKYRDYMILYTAGEKVDAVVDGAPPGKNGRLYSVEPDKAVKVPYEAGRFMIDHLGYTGVVRVNETEKEDGSGTEYDISTARAESLAKFEQEDERRWNDYIRFCIDDKINQKRAVPATPDPIKRLMARRGYRLSDFGIVPIGEVQPENAAMKALQDQVKELTKKLEDAIGGA